MSAPAAPPLRALRRAEGAAVALAAGVLAWSLGPPWPLVLLVLVAPDLGIAAYAFGPRVGATVYNALHAYVGPAALAVAAVVTGGGTLAAVAALWAAHIGFDRALGYGLKHPTGFADTHLGRIGRG